LGLEPLEGRRLLAGNVTAALVKGVVQINGDKESNGIEIGQDQATGDLIVAGDSSTTINGSSGPLTISRSAGAAVNITMGGGDDSVQLVEVGVLIIEQPPGILFPKPTVPLAGLTIDTGQGNDSVGLQGVYVAGDVSINAGGGDDTVGQSFTVAGGSMSINVGEGNDVIILQDEVFTGPALSIYTGTGDDSVEMQVEVGYAGVITGAPITPGVLLVNTGPGDDTVALGLVVAESATLEGGSQRTGDTLYNLSNLFTDTPPTVDGFEFFF
jgi:hypothetical protein